MHKIGIFAVGVPLAVVLNRYTTQLAGRHSQAVFRSEARVIEIAQGLSMRSQHPQLMLWVAWLVIMPDHRIADDDVNGHLDVPGFGQLNVPTRC